ncbi:MAG TPA: winged helix-turn-helix domain-containing protein, partial [Oceanospirillales bacterium]|nr:winged helix-turn-helix domain-containing protein [Oceanospirillales bacterium]
MKKHCVNISLKQARNLLFASQKLTGHNTEPQKIIEHLGYVQIDTISVVARAHHHVFWSRCAKYQPSDLDELVKSRKVFEYWSHAASYLPMIEYRYTLPMKHEFKNMKNSWFPRDEKMMSAVLKRIEAEGPMRSKDFGSAKKGTTGWWDWKPAKKALERLFMEGKLEISKRQGFQKVYDLPQRVIPPSVDISMPTEDEYHKFLIKRTLRHHGLATAHEIAYLKKKQTRTKVADILAQMHENGEVVKVSVEKIEQNYYAEPAAIDNINKKSAKIHILSPFDNLVIQRKKLDTLFDFHYQIECYVPAAKRKYGYFSLPIFQGNQAIARIDCKADRRKKQLIINALYYEKGVNKNSIKPKIEAKLKQFARFNDC